MHFQHNKLQMNSYEHWICGVNFIIIVFGCQITGIMFSIALLKIWWLLIIFCVISAAKLFWRLQNVQQDYALNP